MRMIFMGTPEFAVASLQALIEAGEQVVAVVTGPDKPAGRGQKLRQSAVKEFALTHGIPVLQPEKLRDPDFIAALRSYKADLQVVVAFRMLPELVWNMPPMGTINLHASLLPQYRGAAPINHVIINGETETGVTTFLLQQEIDTGHILLTEKTPISPDETAGELHDRLMQIGAVTLVKTVQALRTGSLTAIPQENIILGDRADAEPVVTALKAAPKIFKEHCQVDWNLPSDVIYNQIRGLSPYPTAFTYLQDKTLKLYKTRKVPFDTLSGSGPDRPSPGSVSSDGKTYLRFAAQDGWIELLELQLEGKRKMEIHDFLKGFRQN